MTLPKTLGFNSFLTVDYAPGQDPLIKRRAKRRKGDETETSGPSEAVDVEENIKGWKNAASDLSKWRSGQGKNVKLVALKKDGAESKLSDATSLHRDEDDAHIVHKRRVDLNPGKKIRHNMYVDGKLVKTLGEDVNESNVFSHLSDEELEDRTKFHKTKRNAAAGGVNSAAYLHHADMAKKAKEEMIRRQQSSAAARKNEVREELDEAVLNPAQRRQKALTMRRLAPKIRLGQERAKNRFADMDRLKHRAKKAARTAIFRKLTKGIPKDELTYQRRQEIEKRLNSPAMKARIERIALKMLPKERQMEVDRHKSKPAEEK